MKPENMFLGIHGKKSGNISIIPVPYEGTCSYRRGTADAPEKIIEASHHIETYDDEYGIDIASFGIRTITPLEPASTPEEMIDDIETAVASELLKGRFPITIGGCHTVSIGAAKAFQKDFKDLSILSLDAHADMKDEYDNSPLSHACANRRMSELCPITIAGIRSMDQDETAFIKSNKIPMITAREMHKNGWIDKISKTLGKEVYISIDIDIFDASLMPATGAPEPGGPGWYDIISLIEKISEKHDIVGFDIVEFSPIKRIHAYEAIIARLCCKLLAIIGRKKWA